MTREAIANHILESFQQVDESIKIISVPCSYYQRLSTSSMYQDQETNSLTKQYLRYISDLLINTKGAMTGNLWFNSPTIYSALKRSSEFCKHLTTKYRIYVSANRLDSPRTTEIGYFLHRLVRHDTVEDINYTRCFLPENAPKFQQDQTTIWAGPSNQKRSTGVISISTAPEYASEMTLLMANTFKNKNNMTFISKNYFNSLDDISRLQHVESQIQYTRTHRSIIFRNIKESHVPTNIYKSDNSRTKMLLTEWITNLQDYKDRPIFLQVFFAGKQLNQSTHIGKQRITSIRVGKKLHRPYCKSHMQIGIP
jgi:hypothetical protein